VPKKRSAASPTERWLALLDAHDAVVRAQLSRFRGRDAVQALGIQVRAG